MNVTQVLKRWKDLDSSKGHWRGHWEDLSRIFLPSRGGFTSDSVEGQRDVDIFDGTPMQAARSLANAVSWMMRPEGIPKIKIETDDDSLNDLSIVKDWLSLSSEILADAMGNPKARYRQAASEKDLDLVVFGTAALFIGEMQNRLFYQSLHLKDCTPVFGELGAEGMFIKRNLSIRQLANKFGVNNLSEQSRKKYENKPDEKINVLHCVIPREGKNNPLFSKDFPVTDTWIEIEAKHVISEGGFHEFPFVVPRWDTTSGEDYGRSPGMIALPDGETLQAMGETILIAGQRAADPPLMAPNDGSFDALNTFPGGLSYYDVETAAKVRGNPFYPLESGANLPISRDMQADARDQIFSAFFKNILNLPIDGPEMTATEVIQRKDEMIREVGPTFGKLESDDIGPAIERSFMIILRAGGFPPIPKELQGQNIKFEYDSPIKRIRKQIDAAAAKLWVSEQIAISEIRPEQTDNINFDEYAKFTHEAGGVPDKLLNNEEDISKIREARQAQQEEQARLAQLQQQFETVKTGKEAFQQ